MTTGFAAASRAVAHVFVDDLDDDELWVDGDDGHHLQRVRRLRVDEIVTASDGRGLWRECAITEAQDGRLQLTATGPTITELRLEPRLVVAFAPAKGDQAGAVVHQLVELGVDAVMPITLRRSVVRWDGSRGERTREKLSRVMREAAMQSRRARLPELLPALELPELAAHPGLVVADPGGAAPDALGAPVGGEWLVVIGPEGGLDPSERDLLAAGRLLAIGPHVLRAVTAPVAAAAALAGFRTRVAPDSSELPEAGA